MFSITIIAITAAVVGWVSKGIVMARVEATKLEAEAKAEAVKLEVELKSKL